MKKVNYLSTGLMAFLLCFFSQKTKATSNDSIATFSSGAGIEIKFLRLEHDSIKKSNVDTSRILYQVKILGGSKYKDLSHFYITVGNCLKKKNVRGGLLQSGKLSYCSHIELNSSGQLKYDDQLNKGGTYIVFFEVDTILGTSITEIGAKAGTPTYKDQILGFDKNCKEPVPVYFARVSAVSGDNVTSVYWTTATENNNKMFEIERSKGDGKWVKVGEKPGAGNSWQNRNYEFHDQNPPAGVSYYRIKQIDYDGRFAYSIIVSASLNFGPGIQIYPNPSIAGDAIAINTYGFSEENHTVKIYNKMGMLIFSWDLQGNGNIIYPILPSGTYTIISSGVDGMGRYKDFQARLIIR